MRRHQLLKIVFAALAFVSMSAFACDDDDVDLKLNQIKSIQVTYGTSIYPEIGVSPDNLIHPFQEALIKRGVKIDRNNYDDVIDVHVDMAKQVLGGVATYAVVLKFRYTEPCVANRIGMTTNCELWSDYEQIKIFTDPASVREYILDNVNKQASLFMGMFR